MKKLLLLLIFLLIVGAIFFIKKKDNTVSIQKTEVTKKPSITTENKVITIEKSTKKPILAKVITQEKEPNSKPFKTNVQNNTTDETIDDTTNENFQKERREYVILNEFKEIYPDMLEEIKKIPACLGKANSREEALNCHEIFSKVKRELAMITGEYEGEGNYSASGFVWNQEIKQKMIEEVEITIPTIYEQKACVEDAQNKIELEQCLEIQ